MSSSPLPNHEPEFKKTTQESVCQKYSSALRSYATKKRSRLVMPAPAIILNAETFLGRGVRLGPC